MTRVGNILFIIPVLYLFENSVFCLNKSKTNDRGTNSFAKSQLNSLIKRLATNEFRDLSRNKSSGDGGS